MKKPQARQMLQNAALIRAAERGDPGELRRALEKGAQVDATRPGSGWTPAMAATHIGHEECLRALLDAGCDFDAKNLKGWTAAMTASEFGHAGCLRMLIDAGCRIDDRDAEGESAAMVAARRGHADCLALLMQAGCDIATPDHHGSSVSNYARLHPSCFAILEAFALAHAPPNGPKLPSVRL